MPPHCELLERRPPKGYGRRMRTSLPGALAVSALLAFGTACGGSEPPPAAPAAPPLTPEPVAVASVAPVEAPPPAPEPTPEEKKKAEALRELQQDRAKWEAANKAEVARWTPEVHAAAKALAQKAFPTGKAAIQAAMAGAQRKPGDADRDPARHPAETLAFFGLKPTMTVLEVGPGEGWYTELLAPALAAKGKLVATTSDPNGPADSRGTFGAQRYRAFLDNAPEIYGNVKTVVVDGKAPSLNMDGTLDMALLMREVHGMIGNGVLDAWLGELHKALKAGGVLGIEEHRERAGVESDADVMASAKRGYVPERWLIAHIEAKGFKLVGKAEINANPKDTKDYPEGVWALPPTLQLGDKDRAKYAAIGESDRMTLKFVKR